MSIIPQDKYCEILEAVPICCVDILIQHKGKILLIRRENHPSKGEWWTPGGRIHKNESLKSAAVRKSFEETGLKVRIKQRIGVYEYLSNDSHFPGVKSGIHTVSICFLAEPLSKTLEVALDSAHSDFKWVDKNREFNKFPVYIKQLLKESGVVKK